MNRGAEIVGKIIEILAAAGWAPDGTTLTETVRVPTSKNPVLNGGKSGGELRTFGGRLRFVKGGRCATIGPRTTNFYEVRGGQTVNLVNVKSLDVNKIWELATQ